MNVHADRLKRLAATASVAVATLLIVAKAAAWLTTGSISLLSTLIDSALDLAASLINLVAIRQAAQPPDKEHRFGHGKAEPLAGLAQAGFVCGSAGFVLVHAGERLIRPAPINNTEVGYAVMALSIALTVGLVLYQRFVVRRTGSLAIGADSLHYSADLLTNLSVIVALVLSTQFGWIWADPLTAIAIGVFILSSAWQIIKQSLNLLMDRELPDEDREHIRRIARSHPEVIGIHDLRTRSSGTHLFIQFHLELDGNMTLLDAHTIADQVMSELERVFPDAEVLIHEDPHGVSERRASFS
ncbi:MAG: cation diffusion facilitator family transporter [Hyphomicrobium sp.]